MNGYLGLLYQIMLNADGKVTSIKEKDNTYIISVDAVVTRVIDTYTRKTREGVAPYKFILTPVGNKRWMKS
jgi:hypothetical protein